MSRRRLILIVGACTVVGILAAALWSGPREPEYRGRKLSEWLDRAVEIPGGVDVLGDEVMNAIQHIGTNATPWLLRWACYESPVWKVKLMQLGNRLGVNVGRDERKSLRGDYAWSALEILGPQASSAIPTLARLMLDSPSDFFAYRAALVLGSIGPEALPILLSASTNSPVRSRSDATTSMGTMRDLGTNTGLVLHALINCLKDKEVDVADAAAIALGNLGECPEEVVPALAQSLSHTNAGVRRRAAISLGKFPQSPEAVVPCLVSALKDSDYGVRNNATNALRKVAPEVLTNGVAK